MICSDNTDSQGSCFFFLIAIKKKKEIHCIEVETKMSDFQNLDKLKCSGFFFFKIIWVN